MSIFFGFKIISLIYIELIQKEYFVMVGSSLSGDPFLTNLPTGLREDPSMAWQQFALSQAQNTWDQDPFRLQNI